MEFHNVIGVAVRLSLRGSLLQSIYIAVQILLDSLFFTHIEMASFNSHDLINRKGIKRPINNEEEESNRRLFQRPRTSEFETSINCVSSQVSDLTLIDNDDMDMNMNMDFVESHKTNTTHVSEYIGEFASRAAFAVDIVSNFVPFGSLISNIYKAGEEIISLYQKAEYHKEICSHMTQRVIAAMAAVKDLKTRKNENEKFFTEENLQIFKGFVRCMWKIRDYISEISQLGKMRKIIKANMIEQKFKELTLEFEGYMKSLQFAIIVQSNLDMNAEIQKIEQNVRQVKEMLSHIHGGITDSHNHISWKIPQVRNMNIEFLNQQNNRGLESSHLELLDLNLYEKEPNVTRRNITKWLNIQYGVEVAFKEFTNNTSDNSSEMENDICKQVAILQHLQQSSHIIKFYGIAKDGFKYYLVTEWMENKNLLEYYECHPLIAWSKKLDFAVDICRGLIFLNAVEILHRDLRGANMLVDKNHKVKIANFGLSRRFTEVTRNIQTSLETVKYMAPEKLSKGDKYTYDIKCEIYSLGALLWEIAEQRPPFSSGNLEFQAIRDLVVKTRYREPLSPGVPELWKKVVTQALRHSPSDRPAISYIFENLYQCQKLCDPQPQLVSSSFDTEMDDGFGSESEILDIGQTPIEDSGCISVQEAIEEHKKGNFQAAWRWFFYHAENGDMLAKFWVACYLYQSEIDELKCNKEENRVKAAQLFKETADNGKHEAQLRYGSCLWQGKGVRTNYNEAIRYLTMAADNGNVNAMYNVGCAYYKGKGVEKSKTKGEYYLKKAARKEHPKSIEMCKSYTVMSQSVDCIHHEDSSPRRLQTQLLTSHMIQFSLSQSRSVTNDPTNPAFRINAQRANIFQFFNITTMLVP
ncbi:9058_t:CDS:2 [Acaulospora morrowiae]|uniref:9058_t:CDS:1 n=1 Tax=Acaulospora morrowiae TaxID=94023 RepID=A0A9N9FIU3_9GLOM|nr:9058_t:CDS:2 [Acaulospora morrowiae]